MAFTRDMEQKIHAQSHGKYVLFCRYVRHAKKKLLDFANKKANKKSNLVSCHWHPQTHVWHALNIYLYLYLYTAKLTYVTCIVFGYVFLSISTFSGITLCTSCLPLAIKSLAPTFAYLWSIFFSFGVFAQQSLLSGSTTKNSQFYLPPKQNHIVFAVIRWASYQVSKQTIEWTSKRTCVCAIHSVWFSRFNEPDLLISCFIQSQIIFLSIESSKWKSNYFQFFFSF